MKIGAITVLVFGLGGGLIFGGLYWLLALIAPIPGFVSLRAAYGSTARRIGVGVEYQTGPYMILALIFFGGAIMYFYVQGLRDAD